MPGSPYTFANSSTAWLRCLAALSQWDSFISVCVPTPVLVIQSMQEYICIKAHEWFYRFLA